ncbi:MAG: hypothetical protein PHI27_02940 [Eubacteriales bacterium]|nr:hypothetical protein [Eubacteriales bacterium]MDD3881191.1 hypothetical protein [Eubacteriales bacterium]MDD4511573.1 hypothetical protein [Eubacteriales bacterium]
MKKLLSALCASLFVLLTLFAPVYVRLSRIIPKTPGIAEKRLETLVIWQLGTLVNSGGELLRAVSAFEKDSGGTRVFLRIASAAELAADGIKPDIYLFTPENAPHEELLSAKPLPLYSEFYSLVYPASLLGGEEFSLEKLAGAKTAQGQTLCALSPGFSPLPLALLGCPVDAEAFSSEYAAKKALREGRALCAVLPDGAAAEITAENDMYAAEILPPATERTVYIGLAKEPREETLALLDYLLFGGIEGGFQARGLFFHAGEMRGAIVPEPFSFSAEREAQLRSALVALRDGDARAAEAVWGSGNPSD